MEDTSPAAADSEAPKDEGEVAAESVTNGNDSDLSLEEIPLPQDSIADTNVQDDTSSDKPTGSPKKSDAAKIYQPNNLDLPDPKVPRLAVRSDSSRGVIDTRAPISSVKQAVSKFGGIVDWKAHKTRTVERRRHVEHELEKAEQEIPQYKRRSDEAEESKQQILKELDTSKRLIEELKLNLERAQTEEQQAKQDSELAQLRGEEMEQGVADDASVAAKKQLEVARARHTGALTELGSVKAQLESLREEYASLLVAKEEAIKKAQEAAAAAKKVEKTTEDLTIDLIATRETLETAQAAHLEAEELRVGAATAREQDSLYWEKELKQAEDELKKLRHQVSSSKDLRLKLETASMLLVDLKFELDNYMESKQKQDSEAGIQVSELKNDIDIQEAVASAKMELEEVKSNIEKAVAETNGLKVAASSLQAELETEKVALGAIKQREGTASLAVSALETELERTKSEISEIQMKEKEIKENKLDMPSQLQQAANEAEGAKSRVEKAREELMVVKEEMEQAKGGASSVESRLVATRKEIEAARAAENLALAAVKALKESESARITSSDVDTPSGITLTLEEYYELSKRAHDAEEQANLRVATAISQIEVAKEAEMKSMEKLEQVNKELGSRKEALKIAQEKAEVAKERKLGVEQELRKWRSEHEQQRKANESNSPRKSSEDNAKSNSEYNQDDELYPSPKEYEHVLHEETDSSNPGKSGKKKKKSVLPKLFMFMGKKKEKQSK